MHRNTVGGYQGPVLVLAPDGAEVARAACRYRAEGDRDGEDYWTGRLHRIEPAGAVVAGRYRLRFPEGQEGEMTIRAFARNDAIAYFDGIGTRPI